LIALALSWRDEAQQRPIMWAKLETLASGARLASKQLWS
jgi:hypothetical protein